MARMAGKSTCSGHLWLNRARLPASIRCCQRPRSVFVLLWSTGFIVAKYAAPHAPPLTFLLYRFAGAVAILLPLVVIAKAPWPRGASGWRDVIIVGVLLQATYLGGVWCAIALGMPAGVSALLVGVQPLLTALLAFTVNERAIAAAMGGLGGWFRRRCVGAVGPINAGRGPAACPGS